MTTGGQPRLLLQQSGSRAAAGQQQGGRERQSVPPLASLQLLLQQLQQLLLMGVDGDRKWADFELEDEGDLADLAAVPGGFETRPDEDGIKTVTNYLQNSKGETVKVVKRVRVTKVVHRVNRAVLERSNIPFFGIEADETSTAKAFTVRSVEEVPLEVSKETLLRAKFRDDDDDEDIQFADLNPAKTSRDLRQKFLSLQNDEDPIDGGEFDALGSKLGGMGKGLARLRGSANDSLKDLESRRREEATIRVTNLSEDVKEEDLTELFGTIGKLERVFLAKHKDKKASKGFAFITYATRDMAAQAIRKLNRHGYDNLLLNVSCMQPHSFLLTPSSAVVVVVAAAAGHCFNVSLVCCVSSGRVGQAQQPREVITESLASIKRSSSRCSRSCCCTCCCSFNCCSSGSNGLGKVLWGVASAAAAAAMRASVAVRRFVLLHALLAYAGGWLARPPSFPLTFLAECLTS
ncbi:hypothetical protein Emed_002797 [Eimeria media]